MQPKNKWDSRYSEPGYAYGTRPNDFLAERIDLLPESGKVLCLAEGEGRNAVFLASHGYDVVAVDSSPVGLQKALELARIRSVHIRTIVADLAGFSIEPESYDAVISIYCHLPPDVRKQVHKRIRSGLKPGGILLLEGYTPDQLQHATGGPPSSELMMNLQMLTTEFSGLEILHATELERDIHEGRLHTGLGSVVQFIARKP